MDKKSFINIGKLSPSQRSMILYNEQVRSILWMWGYFHMRLAFKSVDWVKQISLWRGWASFNSLRDYIEQKGAQRENFMMKCWTRIWVFCPVTWNYSISLLILRLSDSVNCTTSFPGFPIYRQHTVGLLSFHTCVSQSANSLWKINRYLIAIYLYTSIS